MNETGDTGEYEWMVRSYYAALDRTIETGPTDEDTARIIAMDDERDGWTRTLLRRRKASPWTAEGSPS